MVCHGENVPVALADSVPDGGSFGTPKARFGMIEKTA